MSDRRQTSNRSKKRTVAAGLRALQNKPGWDPHAHVTQSPEQRLSELASNARQSKAYDQATACPACMAAQTETGDTTALCETHMAAAMGF